jgi:hypothetical protein
MSVVAEQEEAEYRAAPRWRLPDGETTESIGGTHQLHRFVGRWDGEVGEWVVLCEKESGEALLDMARVKTAKVSWRGDGALLVRLEGLRGVRLIIVDPAIRSFRDIGIDERPRPVAELQGAVATAAREVGADGGYGHPRDPYLERDFSPDGTVMVEYSIQPQRMSHETRVPALIDVATGNVLLAMPNSLYDGVIHWREGTRAHLHVRRYDDGAAAWFDIDYAARSYWRADDIDRPLPLKGIGKEIVRATGRAATADRPPPPSPQVEWRNILLVLLFSVLLVGGIALASWYFTGPPKQQLTPVPEFPLKKLP